MNVKIYTKALVVLVLGLLAYPSAAQYSRLSIDVTGGTPTLLSNAQPLVSPFGGAGIRYSLNRFVSVQGQVNGGAITGKNDGQFFRNNFLYYGMRLNLNVTGFNNKPRFLEKFNIYLYGATGFMDYYRNAKSEFANNNASSSNYYIATGGLNIRYYCNEMLDFIAGSEINFSQTENIDNNRNGSYDKFALTYAGISIKLMPKQRKQYVDWANVKLPYITDPATKEIHHITRIESKEILVKDQSVDSISQLFSNRISGVDTKLDTISRAIADLYLLLKSQPQPVKMQEEQPASQPLRFTDRNDSLPKYTGARKSAAPHNEEEMQASEPQARFVASNKAKGPAASSDFRVTTASYQPVKPVAYAKTASASAQPTAPARVANISTPAETVQAESNAASDYSVVIGAFNKSANAEKLANALKDKGYNVSIAEHSGMKRVLIHTQEEMDKQVLLDAMRRDITPDAWLLLLEKE